MREIKFRAYIKNLKWTVPVTRINFDCETIEVDLTDGNGDIAEYDFDEIILMQYTGLKDKNGVEIYEGNIIAYIRNVRAARDTKVYGKIFYDFSAGAFCVEQQFVSLPPLLADINCEVIGNIHDNPELMKGGEE